MQTAPERRRPRHRIVLAATALVGMIAVTGCQRPVAGPGGSGAATASERCRVLTAESGAERVLERDLLLRSCARALPAVAEAWPEWTGDVVIRISSEALAPGTAAQVEGVARSGEPTRGDRVVVARGLTDALSPEGLDVVLRHELSHLALRSTGTAPLPLWASEGIAMHVGYASVSGPRRERRPELVRLLDRVERGDWPTTVPTSARFDDPDDRADAYSAAWLGVEVLIDRLGRDRVLEALRSVRPTDASGGSAGEVFMDDSDGARHTDDGRTQQLLASLGVSERWLAEQWRAELVRRTS